jgi:hypothetical protein
VAARAFACGGINGVSTAQIESLRNAAASERTAAEGASLPRVRERHLRAAEAWDAMAEHAEVTEERSKTNAEGYVKYAYQRERSERSQR